MQAAGLTLAQTAARRSKTPANAALGGENNSARTHRRGIISWNLKADLDLERKISKTAGPMLIAFFHGKSVADSQNFKNLAGRGVLVGLWLLFRSEHRRPWSRAETTRNDAAGSTVWT